ncbi:hypothetical protein KPH14_011118 [Odynerus spinipes]|uniref:Uncharacterized protein n=1 Tax=Odynerus spinipes TaxID=1348599 RepID=A0AAD9RGL1_9HYME|nr:hypothetical protein KPH14_011118 [Odynerus spinipes]
METTAERPKSDMSTVSTHGGDHRLLWWITRLNHRLYTLLIVSHLNVIKEVFKVFRKQSNRVINKLSNKKWSGYIKYWIYVL